MIINTKTTLQEENYYEDVTISKIHLEGEPLRDISFHDCRFENCSFTDVDLSGSTFRDCRFINCQWSTVILFNTILGNTEFDQCKLMGLNFTDCNHFSFSPDFFNTLLDNSVFYNLDMSQRKFRECQIKNCDFTEVDLREADFRKSQFRDTLFQQCKMEKSTFVDAQGYTIDPISNKIGGARFSQPDVMSFLAYLGIEIEE